MHDSTEVEPAVSVPTSDWIFTCDLQFCQPSRAFPICSRPLGRCTGRFMPLSPFTRAGLWHSFDQPTSLGPRWCVRPPMVWMAPKLTPQVLPHGSSPNDKARLNKLQICVALQVMAEVNSQTLEETESFLTLAGEQSLSPSWSTSYRTPHVRTMLVSGISRVCISKRRSSVYICYIALTPCT